ncbi:MAG: sel1 repeat family protein [Desulforudis sp.]|jgi:TPR repeat protein|nr:MAG: sel1 repeat family protein [Desulforudis sp.]
MANIVVGSYDPDDLDKRDASQVNEPGTTGKQDEAEVLYQTRHAYFFSGDGVAEDPAEAFQWFQRAAELGHSEAQYKLGYAYQHGQGVAQDMHEAVNWYREAAEQGNVAAQYNLAVVYCDGEGIDQDYTESFKWLRKAAEAGNPSAQCHPGYSYYSGIFTARDVGKGWNGSAKQLGRDIQGRRIHYVNSVLLQLEDWRCLVRQWK